MQSFSSDGFTNVTSQFDMLTQYGASLCFFYIFVGFCVCIKPLFCISQLLFHVTNMLYIIYLIVITCVMNQAATKACCSVINYNIDGATYLPLRECSYLNGIAWLGWGLPTIAVVTICVAGCLHHKDTKEYVDK